MYGEVGNPRRLSEPASSPMEGGDRAVSELLLPDVAALDVSRVAAGMACASGDRAPAPQEVGGWPLSPGPPSGVVVLEERWLATSCVAAAVLSSSNPVSGRSE